MTPEDVCNPAIAKTIVEDEDTEVIVAGIGKQIVARVGDRVGDQRWL